MLILLWHHLTNNISGNSLLSKTSGFNSHLSDASPLTPSHIFRQASATKLLTSICAIQLVQNKILALDDPIDSNLPELAKQQIITVNPDGSFIFTPPKNKITLRMLLTHTSGLGYDIVDPRLQAWRKFRDEKPQALQGNVEFMIQMPLLFEPGEGWMYGAGIDAVGVLIQRVTKMGLEEYMQQNIFEPLGMKNSTFFIKKHPELQDRLVAITQRSAGGELGEGNSANGDDPAEASGGGGIYMSPDDYLAVLKDIISETPKLLRPNAAQMLFSCKSQLKEGTPAMEHFKRAMPMLAMTLSVLVKDVEINQTLGGLLIMGNSPHLGKTKGTLAWAGALGTLWFANRSRGFAGYYATQLFPPGDAKNLKLMEEFIREAFRIAPEEEEDSGCTMMD